MARPKSEDKRNAILAAATEVIALQGDSAPTAKIARMAGVAEGSLFTYFANKDELLNQLYLTLKNDMGAMMLADYPAGGSRRERFHHVWHRYVSWGAKRPQQRKAMAMLGISERVSAATKLAGMQAFGDIQALVAECMAGGPLQDRPSAFAAAVLGTLADTTMDFMARFPAEAGQYQASGFEACWHAIAGK
jgi:AcrR family transcriptional regulator